MDSCWFIGLLSIFMMGIYTEENISRVKGVSPITIKHYISPIMVRWAFFVNSTPIQENSWVFALLSYSFIFQDFAKQFLLLFGKSCVRMIFNITRIISCCSKFQNFSFRYLDIYFFDSIL